MLIIFRAVLEATGAISLSQVMVMLLPNEPNKAENKITGDVEMSALIQDE